MPYAYIKKKIKLGEYDRRKSALTDDDRDMIRRLHKEGMAIREIARRCEKLCSRRTVQYIIFPERLEVVKAQFKERRKDGRYKPTKKEWNKTMREHRHYKQSIVKSGKIK